MLLLNCSNTDNIRFYRLLWRYVKIHEIGTEITIPNFIFILSPLKVLILQAFLAYELCRCYNWCYIFITNIRIFIELYNLQRTCYKFNFFVFFVLSDMDI